ARGGRQGGGSWGRHGEGKGRGPGGGPGLPRRREGRPRGPGPTRQVINRPSFRGVETHLCPPISFVRRPAMSKHQNYPRGLPFRAPQHSVSPTATPRAVAPVAQTPGSPVAPPHRLPLFLALYCIGFLVLGLGLGSFFVSK